MENFLFHLVDGLIKVFFLVSYIYLISRMKDIQRIFQYHGAEHKCIYAYEAGEELTVTNARKFSTLHPRCGTAFLLDRSHHQHPSFLGPLSFSAQVSFLWEKDLTNLIYVGIKLPLLFPIAGLAYEVIKLSGKKADHPDPAELSSPRVFGSSISPPGHANGRPDRDCPASPSGRLEAGIRRKRSFRFNLKEFLDEDERRWTGLLKMK